MLILAFRGHALKFCGHALLRCLLHLFLKRRGDVFWALVVFRSNPAELPAGKAPQGVETAIVIGAQNALLVTRR